MNSRRCSEISVLIDLTASLSCRGGGWLNMHAVHPEGSTASMHWVAAVWLADQLFVSMCSWADPAAAATYKKKSILWICQRPYLKKYKKKKNETHPDSPQWPQFKMQPDLSFSQTKRSKLAGQHRQGGNHEINIWTFCNFLAHSHSGKYDTCFPRRFYLRCCQNVLIKCIPGGRGLKSCMIWVKRRGQRFMWQRNGCWCYAQKDRTVKMWIKRGLLGTSTPLILFACSYCWPARPPLIILTQSH